jgi:hypothetical protein
MNNTTSNRNVFFLVFGLCIFLNAGCGEAPVSEAPLEEATTPRPEEPVKKKKIPLVQKKKKPGPVEHIDSAERLAAVKLIQATDPIQQELRVYNAEIRGAFDEQQFTMLDSKADELRKSKVLFGDGSWKIAIFYEGLSNRFHSGENGFLTDFENYAKWMKLNPKSVSAHIGLAGLLTDYAWHARGRGYAKTVSKSQWQLFHERLAEARAMLDESRKLSKNDPYWGVASMTVALGQGWDRSDYDALVEEVLKSEPTFWEMDTERAYSLIPRWYGEEGDWQAYAEKASNRTDGLGAEAYARIVMEMVGYYGNVFRDAKASWPKTREGMEILRKKYPDSLKYVNYTARFAPMGRDRKLAKEMFDQLGDNYLKSVWKKPERFVHLRTWAETGKW